MPDLQQLLADLTSGDDIRAESAISPILNLGMEAIPTLVQLATAGEVDSRWWAVRTLASSPHTRTEDLLPLLHDAAPEIREAAALALCNLVDPKSVIPLIQSLWDDDSLTVDLAGCALVKIGGPAVEALLEVMRDAPLAVRIPALRALAEIQDPRAIPIMLQCLGEESAILQYWAQQGLERLGTDMVYIKP